MTENVYYVMLVKHRLNYQCRNNADKAKGILVLSHKRVYKEVWGQNHHNFMFFLSIGFEKGNSLLLLSTHRPPSLLQPFLKIDPTLIQVKQCFLMVS
jgi:hypothetical protein